MAIGKGLNASGANPNDVFRKHIDLNNKLKSHLERILKYIKRIHTLDDLEKKDVLGFFSSWVGVGGINPLNKNNYSYYNDELSQMRTIFDSLEWEDKEILNLLEGPSGLLQTINIENDEITKFLSNPSPDIVEREKLNEKLIVTYNGQKQRIWENLRTLLGQKDQYTSSLIPKIQKDIEGIADYYLEQYGNLVKLILDEDNSSTMRWDGIYKNLYSIDKTLSMLSGNIKGTFLNTIEQKSQIKKVNKDEVTFAKNYYASNKTFSDYFRKHEEIYKEYEIYSRLPEEEKKDIDRLLSESLSLLFKSVNKKISDKLKDDAGKSDKDFNNLKEEFEKAYGKLLEKLRVESNFDSKLEECGIFHEDGIENGMTFKEFRSKYLKPGNNQYVRRVIDYILTVERDKNAYNKFIENNKSHFKEGSGGSSSSGEDWYKDLPEVSNIIDVIESLGSSLSNLHTTEQSQWESVFASTRPAILREIGIIAKYVNSNRDKLTSVDNLIHNLKTSLDMFKRDINYNERDTYIGFLSRVLDQIKKVLK